MKKVYLIRALGLALTVFMMAFIFSMSSQNATVSNQTSGGVIRFTVSLVYPEFNNLDNKAKEIAQFMLKNYSNEELSKISIIDVRKSFEKIMIDNEDDK